MCVYTYVCVYVYIYIYIYIRIERHKDKVGDLVYIQLKIKKIIHNDIQRDTVY